MALHSYTAEQFQQAFLDLLPRGPVWPKDSDANLVKTVAALMPSAERVASRASNLVQDGFPSTTLELLPEWEASVGLPDPCQGEAPSIEARRSQVVARFANTGGQSVAYLIGYAANLGYPITIKEYAPSRAGVMRAGTAVTAEGSQFAIVVNSALYNLRYFRAGSNTAGEALSTWGNAVLECELTEIKPAHCVMVFTYT